MMSTLRRLFERIPVRQRITTGLVGLMVGSLLIASAVGFFPNEQKEIQHGRTKLCESLAISSTAMVSSGQFATLNATLDSLVNRDEDVLSIGLRTEKDGLLVSAGGHEENWVVGFQSDVEQVQVPVFRNGDTWAYLEVRFRGTGGLLGLNYWAPAWLLIVMIPTCFAQFSFYLRKTLKHLDPSDRVPQHVQDALDTLSVGLLLMDGSNRILFGNSEFAKSTGQDAAQLNGVDASRLSWEDDGDSDLELPWIQAANSRQAVNDQILQMSVLGRRRTYSVNCSKVGKGMMATFDDITLLQEAREAALQANESKSVFLANMSHEIRTPLNAVLGFTDVLRRGLVTDTEESLDHLNMIHHSGKHLLELINDILDLSKIEAGKMDVESIDTQIAKLVFDTVDILNVRARAGDLELKVEFNSPIPRVIQSDPTRLKQIITNLVGNAIKFTEYGSVTVATQMVSDPSPRLRIDITDTGIGMTPEQQLGIFQSFAQADDTTTRRFGGTGLGLSISQHLAGCLGGELIVNSQVGVGSTFSVILPVDSASLNDTLTTDAIMSRYNQSGSARPDKGIIQLAAKEVLVVDDGEANRRLIELVLGRAGAIVTSVQNGLEAIEALSNQNFDLILMDMQMPVMDGYTATRQIRSQGSEIPIVALTGNAMKGDREKCTQAGCTDFLAKPVDIDKLLQLTATFIGQVLVDEPDGADLLSAPSSPEADMSSITKPHAAHKVPPAAGGPIYSTLPMDDEDFHSIVEDFVGRLGDRLNFIEQAISDANYASVNSEAHWLKGVGGTVGLDAFTEPARALERAAIDRQGDQAAEILQSIRDIHRRIDLSRGELEDAGSDQDKFRPLEFELTDTSPIHSTLPMEDSEFRDIVAEFVGRLDDRLAQMQQLSNQQQFAELSEQAHWLKGSGATVGYALLGESAAALERAARLQSGDDVNKYMNVIMAVRHRLVVPLIS